MSRLKLYRPERLEFEIRVDADDGEPAILPFSSFACRFKYHRLMDVVTRARVIHANRRCIYCKHPVIEPIELEDGVLNHNDLSIPGTATLVGFHCIGCHAEWPIPPSIPPARGGD